MYIIGVVDKDSQPEGSVHELSTEVIPRPLPLGNPNARSEEHSLVEFVHLAESLGVRTDKVQVIGGFAQKQFFGHVCIVHGSKKIRN